MVAPIHRPGAGILVPALSSLLTCAAILAAVLQGDWMDGLFRATAEALFRHPAWAVIAGASPIGAALLVGYAQMQRAIRRRAAGRPGS